MNALSSFHFIRPGWLLALLPLLLLLFWMWRQRLFSRSWQAVIDAQLLPHLLIGDAGGQQRWPLLVFALCGVLTIIALAGPSWQKLPQPVYKKQSALIIALDLSRSMDAADIKPSRLARARFKIADLLKLRREGQTGLIVYAADAFTVTPLTDDAATIASLVPTLDTRMMPAQGSRPDRALALARELFTHAGIRDGNVLLITDTVDPRYLAALTDSARAGYPVSILGIGSRDGAPVPAANGGFIKDSSGAIVIAKQNPQQLRQAALNGGGAYSAMTIDDQDIRGIAARVDGPDLDGKLKQTELKSDVWREQGPWLLLLVIPLAALAFRRGYLVLLVFICMPYAPRAQAFDWNALWQNDNQRAAQKLHQQQPEQAAELFDDPQWKSAAHYRAGDYQQSIDALKGMESVDADYNRGNALAKMGQYEQALQAYDRALDKDPNNEDARFNKQQIEQWLQQQQEQQQEQQQSQQNQPQDQQQQSSGSSADSEQQNPQSNEQDQNTQSSSQQQGEQQNQQPSPADADRQSQDQSAQQNQQQQDDQQSDAEQQAAVQQRESNADDQDKDQQNRGIDSEQQQSVSQQKVEQWLRKIPDDPSGLLRRKFEYQYKRRAQQDHENEAW